MQTTINAESNTNLELNEVPVHTNNDQQPVDLASSSNRQNTHGSFDFDSAKSRIEFISVFLALVAVIGTGTLKLISYGRVAYFAFDMNYYNFTLNHTDLIIFIVFICAGALTLLYCNYTSGLRREISHKISNCNKLPLFLSTLFKVFFNVAWFLLLPAAELIIGCILATQFPVLSTTLNELPYVVMISILVLGAIVYTWINYEGNPIVYSIISIFFIVILSLCMMQSKYDEARYQTDYDIIISDENESDNVLDYYAVISTGEYYSAYSCDIVKDGEYNKLIVYTNNHRFFAVDSVATETMHFYRYDEELQYEVPYVMYV